MKTFSLVLAVVVTVACDKSPTGPSALVGETWGLVSMERVGAALINIPDRGRYTIQFQDGGRVTVRSDCNSCSGSYALTGTNLSIGALACTDAFCGATSLDGEFTQALGRAQSMARAGSELTIRSDGVLLRFRN